MRFYKKSTVITLFFSLHVATASDTFYDAKNHLEWEATKHIEKEDKWAVARKHCETLTLKGESDWRLPTVKELQLLAPYIKNAKLPNAVVYGSYWSAEVYEPDDLNAWAVFIETAHPFDEDKCESEHMICVHKRFNP